MKVKARFYAQTTAEGLPCREEHFARREVQLPIPLEASALVLVDVWNIHHVASFVEREQRVLRQGVVPVLDAARAAGMAVIHAPSPRITRKRRPAPRDEAPAATKAAHDDPWPPREFVARSGAYERFGGMWPPVRRLWDEGLQEALDLAPEITVGDGEPMIETGEELDRICRERRILHLFYAGFAMNWCVLNRDYGIRHVSLRGYNTIVLRGAVEGLEYPDTLESGWATELAIREVETQIGGFSADRDDFISALATSRQPGAAR